MHMSKFCCDSGVGFPRWQMLGEICVLYNLIYMLVPTSPANLGQNVDITLCRQPCSHMVLYHA